MNSAEQLSLRPSGRDMPVIRSDGGAGYGFAGQFAPETFGAAVKRFPDGHILALSSIGSGFAERFDNESCYAVGPGLLDSRIVERGCEFPGLPEGGHGESENRCQGDRGYGDSPGVTSNELLQAVRTTRGAGENRQVVEIATDVRGKCAPGSIFSGAGAAVRRVFTRRGVSRTNDWKVRQPALG